MFRRRTEAGEGGKVRLGAVALVCGETIAGIARLQRQHFAVARDFGDDGGGGNAGLAGISTDNGAGGNGKRRGEFAVYQRLRWWRVERSEGALHGKQRRVVDVERIYFSGRCRSGAPGDGLRGDGGVERFALAGA